MSTMKTERRGGKSSPGLKPGGSLPHFIMDNLTQLFEVTIKRIDKDLPLPVYDA